jgi:hypothetical protein
MGNNVSNIAAPVTEALELSSQPIEQPANVDYRDLYQQEKEDNARLRAVIDAGRLQPTAPHPDQNVKPKTLEQARAQVGVERWNHKLTDAEKLVVMGQDPNQDRDFLRKLWGKGADPHLSQDLFRSNPKLYRETKQAALALNIFAA